MKKALLMTLLLCTVAACSGRTIIIEHWGGSGNGSGGGSSPWTLDASSNIIPIDGTQDVILPWKDTDADTVLDTPRRLILDPPPGGAVGQSSILSLVSDGAAQSDVLPFDSTNKSQSDVLEMKANGDSGGSCSGFPSCTRGCSSGLTRCSGSCNRIPCGGGRYRCSAGITCDAYTTQGDCEGEGCTWTPGVVVEKSADLYTDSETLAECYTDSDTDADNYLGEDGSFHMDLSVAGAPTGTFTIEDDGTIVPYAITAQSGLFSMDDDGTVNGAVVNGTVLMTSDGYFHCGQNSCYWDDLGGVGNWYVDGTGVWADNYYAWYQTNITFNSNVDFLNTIGISGSLPLILKDSATVYDDMVVNLLAARVPSSGGPNCEGAFKGGTAACLYSPTVVQKQHVTLQMSHTYKLDSVIDCHVHWAPTTTNTGAVNWTLEYTKADIGGTFGTSKILTCLQNASGTAYSHELCDFHSVGNFTGLSGGFVFTLTRQATNAKDTYTGDAAGLFLDCHYERDSLGSDEEYSKW